MQTVTLTSRSGSSVPSTVISSSTPEGPETNLEQSLVAGDSDGTKCPHTAILSVV
jgi:hypothetical protein